MNTEVRVRFAPSPTGYMHIGGARTALFNYLFARHHGGRFILRIEDTDQKRFQEDALREIYISLEWLGLEWDEGPDRNGPCGPYVQSQRTHLYRKHAQVLLERGTAYRCFCTPERLTRLREEQEKAKMLHGTGYDRLCRNLSPAEIEQNLTQKKTFAIRLKVPLDRTVTFTDHIRGPIETASNLLDDQILLKSDGFPTYHLANVVDDHLMGITHVMRGDEWIASTPRHILLYEAFGWTPPCFAHMPVILAPDGGKLSKRKGAASVMDYKNGGFLSEALFNFLALLGWSPGDNKEILTRQEIIDLFSLARISPKAAVLDETKLEWMNGQYLQNRDPALLLPDAMARWREQGLIDAHRTPDEQFLKKVVSLFQGRSKRIQEIAGQSFYFFRDPDQYEAKAAEKQFSAETNPLFDHLISQLLTVSPFDHTSLERLYRSLAEEKQVSVGKLIHPTRLAVSGVSFGPGLFEMMELLGRETVLRRMDRARQWIDTVRPQTKGAPQ